MDSDESQPKPPVAQLSDGDIEKVADRVEMVSMGLGVAAGVAAAGAVIAAPTGITAVGVAIGIVSAPLIVTAAPIIGGAATVAGTVSGCAYLYLQWKRRKASAKDAGRHTEQSDISG